MRVTTLLPIGVAFMLSACVAGSPGSVMMDSPDQLKAESDWAVCQAYGMNHLDKIKAEINRRNLIPAELWPTIDAGKIGVGDSACAAVIAWGPPAQDNQTTTALGTSHQWVYEHFGGGMSFLYVENGTVTAIQN